jgi:hypothetical protein
MPMIKLWDEDAGQFQRIIELADRNRGVDKIDDMYRNVIDLHSSGMDDEGTWIKYWGTF